MPYTANEENAFRTQPQRSRWYLAVSQPASVFSSKIATTPDTYPASAVKLDAAFNTGNSTHASKNMTVWIGALPGASDEGKIRLRTPITNASVMQIAESGCAVNRYTAGMFVTVVRDFAPWPKMPKYNTGASQWRMDWGETYDEQLEKYGPLTIMGPPFAGFLDSGSLSASFVGGSTNFIDSSESATVWTFPDGQTESRIGTEASPVAKIFTGASPGGSYYSFVATDANGVSQISRRLGYIFDDRAQPAQVEFTQISGGLQKGGYQGVARVVSGGTGDSFPDGAEILIFEESSYAGMASTIGGNYPFRTNIVARGWITDDTTTINPFSGDVTFKFKTIDGVLNKTHSKDIFHAYANPPTGTSEWIEAANLSIDRVAIDLVKHRSTIMEVADFHVASGVGFAGKIAFQDLPKSSLWKQLRTNYTERGVRGYVAADLQGNIHAMEDVLINGLSANLPVTMVIGQGDRRDVVQIQHPHYDKNALVELYSVASVTPVGARSPGGDAHGYFGGTTIHERGLIAEELAPEAQQILTVWSGNLRAKLNNPFPKTAVPLAGNYKLDSVPQKRVQMSLSSTENVRGLDWSNKQFLPTGTILTYSKETGTVLTALELESIVDGKGGSAITFERIVPMPPQPTTPLPVPPFSNASLVVFNDTQGTFMRNAAWANINTGLTGVELQDFTGTKSGTNNVLYKGVVGKILKTENQGTTWSDVTPGSDPASSAASAVDYIWYEPDPTDNTKHYFVARNEIGGTWYSWLLHHDSAASTNAWAMIPTGGGAATIGTSVASYNALYNQLPELYDSAVEFVLGFNQPEEFPKSVAKIDASNFVVGATDSTSNWNLYVTNFEIVSDGSINSGPRQSINDLQTDAFYVRNIPGTNLTVLSVAQLESASTNVYGRILQNNAGSLTTGAYQQISNTSFKALGGDHYVSPNVAIPNSSELIFTFADAGENLITRTTRSGLTITAGGTIYDFARFNSKSNIYHKSVELDGDKVASTAIVQRTTDTSLLNWLHDLNGASIVSYGPFATCISTDITNAEPQVGIIGLRKNLFITTVASKTQYIYAYPCSATFSPSLSVTAGTPLAIEIGDANETVTDVAVEKINASNFIVSGYSASSGIGFRTVVVNMNDAGTSMNAGPPTTTEYDSSGASFQPNDLSVGMVSGDKGVIIASNTGSDLSTEPISTVVFNLATTPGGGNGKALGMSIGGTGDTAYTTYTDNTNLKLDVTAVPGLTNVRDIDLGVGTVNQATSKTQIAYPQTIAGNDNFAYIFGRMSSPAGLTDPVHIIKTEDRGATFTTVENSWGADHAGAITRQGAVAYAIRNVGTIGAFYTMASGNFLNSTMPFPVNPGGLISTNDGYVITGASTPESNAIRYSVAPFTRWYRLSGYANSGGVTGMTLIS